MANKYYLQVHDNNTAQHDENDDTFFLLFSWKLLFFRFVQSVVRVLKESPAVIITMNHKLCVFSLKSSPTSLYGVTLDRSRITSESKVKTTSNIFFIYLVFNNLIIITMRMRHDGQGWKVCRSLFLPIITFFRKGKNHKIFTSMNGEIRKGGLIWHNLLWHPYFCCRFVIKMS